MNYGQYETSGRVPYCIRKRFRELQIKYPLLKGWELLSIKQVVDEVRTLGACSHCYKHIILCRWLWDLDLPTHSDLFEILYHEVAHALVGPGKGHGNEWRHMAKVVGCKHSNHKRAREWMTLKVPPYLQAAMKKS